MIVLSTLVIKLNLVESIQVRVLSMLFNEKSRSSVFDLNLSQFYLQQTSLSLIKIFVRVVNKFYDTIL